MPKTACNVCGVICEDGRCSKHPRRAKNAPWSTGRDRGAQAKFRRETGNASGWQCAAVVDGARCPESDPTRLDAHHMPDGTGVLLCNEHHVAVDPHARRRVSA